jgi:23S rRNA (guanosine2251-2'-O)-methyltransferase
MTRKDHRRGGRSADAPTAAPPGKKARTTPPGAAREARPQKPGRREPRGGADFVRIYGFHAVSAALRAPRRELVRLYATEAAAERLAAEIASRGVETKIVAAEDIAARTPRDAVHQGVLLEARPLAPIDISELPERGLVLALDQITDPHNVGAILRTAAAFAVDALLTTERHTPEFTGALAKSASGGLEHVPICSVVNLARALDELGDLGYWRIGLDSEAAGLLGDAKLVRPLVLVLGAEDKGLRRLTRERCDAMARLELPGAIKSLNVSNACAIALALVQESLNRGERGRAAT